MEGPIVLEFLIDPIGCYQITQGRQTHRILGTFGNPARTTTLKFLWCLRHHCHTLVKPVNSHIASSTNRAAYTTPVRGIPGSCEPQILFVIVHLGGNDSANGGHASIHLKVHSVEVIGGFSIGRQLKYTMEYRLEFLPIARLSRPPSSASRQVVAHTVERHKRRTR